MTTEADLPGTTFPLRYLPRAGLLPELTRQTYSSLGECLREAVLNSVDAGARRVTIDLTGASNGHILVSDDGSGMSQEAALDGFMAVGGSRRFGHAEQHGRIGIGSLAMLHLAQRAQVRTKMAGDPNEVILEISHPWDLERDARLTPLAEFEVGEGRIVATDNPISSQFTEIRLHGLKSGPQAALADAGGVFRVIEELRRLLPLPMNWDAPALRALVEKSPDTAEALRQHSERFGIHVMVRTAWGDFDGLQRRLYGDGGSDAEPIASGPVAVDRAIITADGRDVRILGFMVAQGRAVEEWSGLTGRHQNVAVEERTFFDVLEDPGFRRYIAGEVHVLGDVRREELITIDRRAFSRASSDFSEIRRVMQDEIRAFKVHEVQRPRRARAAVTRRAKQWTAATSAVANALDAAARRLGLPDAPPASHVRWGPFSETSCEEFLLGGLGDDPLSRASLDEALESCEPDPVVDFGPWRLRVRFGYAPRGGPVTFRSRPREVRINLAHPLLREIDPAALRLAVALEVAFLLGADGRAGSLYADVLSIVTPTSE